MSASRMLPALAFGAGLLLAVGALVDWSGVEYSSRLDRGIVLAAGAAVIALAVVGFVWRPEPLVLAIVAGATAMDMGVVNYRDIDEHAFEYVAYPEAAVGIGIYLVLAGATLSLLVGLVALAGVATRRSRFGSARRRAAP